MKQWWMLTFQTKKGKAFAIVEFGTEEEVLKIGGDYSDENDCYFIDYTEND